MAVGTQSSSSIRARVGYFDDFIAYPLVWNIEGIIRSANMRRMALQEVRDGLEASELEAGLLPMTELVLNPKLAMIPTVAISVLGPSNFFVLVSKGFPGEIQRVLVDAEDYGALPFAQLMMVHKIRVRPEFYRSDVPLSPATFNFNADPHDAYLLTGMNALFIRKQAFAFSMDLTQSWYDLTQLPFVLLTWAVKRNIIVGALDRDVADVAKRNVTSEVPSICKREADRLKVPAQAMEAYLTRTLRTTVGPQEITSIRRYIKELMAEHLVDGTPALNVYQPAGTQRFSR